MDQPSKIDLIEYEEQPENRKVGFWSTVLSLVRSHTGMSCLALPFGFMTCGYKLALVALSANTATVYFVTMLLVHTSKLRAPSQYRAHTLPDLARQCYGVKGYTLVASLCIMSECVKIGAFVFFFAASLQSAILPQNSTDERLLLILAVVTVVPTWIFQAKNVTTAQWHRVQIACMALSLTGIVVYALGQLTEFRVARFYNVAQLTRFPLFYGISCGAFEGTEQALEIYYSMKQRNRDFQIALGLALMILMSAYQMLGVVVYLSFAQFTQPLLLANLPDFGSMQWWTRSLFFVGSAINCSLKFARVQTFFT